MPGHNAQWNQCEAGLRQTGEATCLITPTSRYQCRAEGLRVGLQWAAQGAGPGRGPGRPASTEVLRRRRHNFSFYTSRQRFQSQHWRPEGVTPTPPTKSLRRRHFARQRFKVDVGVQSRPPHVTSPTRSRVPPRQLNQGQGTRADLIRAMLIVTHVLRGINRLHQALPWIDLVLAVPCCAHAHTSAWLDCNATRTQPISIEILTVM